MTAIVLRGDARSLPLPDASVDLIVTSPPYFGQRDYRDGGESLAGQIGSEETPQEYVAALLECTREWMRVLKPSGSLFVNLGDKYADGKSLMQLPQRYSIGCTDDLSLILRRDIIWHKLSALPESVTDRCATRHEYLFHFTRQSRYYSAVDEIREPNTGSGGGRQRYADTDHYADLTATSARAYEALGVAGKQTTLQSAAPNPLGKLPGSVWEIAATPLVIPARIAHARCCRGFPKPGCDGLAHRAAFSMELPRRCILGWSPPGICLECGEGRRPVVQRGQIDPNLLARRGGHADWGYSLAAHHGGDPSRRGINLNISGAERLKHSTPTTITGYACACPQPDAPVRPAIVVDPFGGTGTTALVAAAYGRTGVSVDLSGDYCRFARWRTMDPAERAKALEVPKPPPVPDGQGSLFDDWEAV